MPVPEVKQYKGKGFGTALLGKDIGKTMQDILDKQEAATKSAGKEAWWKTALGVAGTIGMGIATAGASTFTQIAGAGAGAYLGRKAGSLAHGATGGTRVSDLKRLEGSLMQKSKKEQGKAFKDMASDMEKGDRTSAALAMLGKAIYTPESKEWLGKKLDWAGKATFGEDFQLPKSIQGLLEPVKKGADTAGASDINYGPFEGDAGDIKPGGYVYPKDAFAGTAKENMFLASKQGLDTGKSVVDQMKVAGVDSSFASRSGLF